MKVSFCSLTIHTYLRLLLHTVSTIDDTTLEIQFGCPGYQLTYRQLTDILYNLLKDEYPWCLLSFMYSVCGDAKTVDCECIPRTSIEIGYGDLIEKCWVTLNYTIETGYFQSFVQQQIVPALAEALVQSVKKNIFPD